MANAISLKSPVLPHSRFRANAVIAVTVAVAVAIAETVVADVVAATTSKSDFLKQNEHVTTEKDKIQKNAEGPYEGFGSKR